MGKTKERRFKAHISASKLNVSNDTTSLLSKSPSGGVSQPITTTDNLFAGIPINVENLFKPEDADFDAKSISGRSHRDIKKDEQHLPKKEKLRRRHERFIQKLEFFKNLKKEMKAKKKRQKTAVVGDMHPLLEALPPSTDTKPALAKRELKQKPRASMKSRRRQKEHLMDIKHFNRVLNDKVFRSDPAKAITDFLKQKVAIERPDLQIT